MTYYILTDSGNRLVKDDGFGFITDPVQIYTDASMPMGASGISLRRDSASYAEALASIISARRPGVMLDPGGGSFLLVSPGGGRLVFDPNVGSSPLEFTNLVFRDVPVPMATLAPVFATSAPAPINWNTQLPPSDYPSQIEKGISVTVLQPIFMEYFGYASTDTPGCAEWRGSMQVDGRAPVDFEGTLYVDISHDSPVEILGGIGPSVTVPYYDITAISKDFPLPVAFGCGLRVDETSVTERNLPSHVDTASPVELLGGVARDSLVPYFDLGVLFRDTGGFQVDHLGILWATLSPPLEELQRATQDVQIGPLEALGRVGPPMVARMEAVGTVRRDTVLSSDFRTILVVDMSHEVLAEFGGAVAARGVIAVERGGGIGPSIIAPLEKTGLLLRDAPVQLAPNALLLALQSVLSEHTSRLALDSKSVPLDHIAAAFRDTPALVDFGTWISESAAIATEKLAAQRQDTAAPLEPQGTVRGLTPAGAAYSGSLKADASVPVNMTAAISAAVAVTVERLATALSTTSDKVAWSGALLVDFPVPEAASAQLQAGGSWPALVEITMQVTRDENIPLGFHGFAFIQKRPTLIGTNGQIMLIGEVG